LRALDLIKEQEWPWSVFINDLRVISELTESPSEFLVFLKRRIRANDYPQFSTVDELDFLMYFLSEGLYFEDGVLNDIDVMHVTGYTDDLDLYYEHLTGRVPTASKPRFPVPDKYRDLVRNIEATGKEGFTKVATALLEGSSETHEYTLSGIETIRRQLAEDGNDHSFTGYFKNPDRGIVFIVTRAFSPSFWAKADHYCKLKKYQMKSDEWILVAIEVQDGGKERYNFRLYEGEWEYDTELQQILDDRNRWVIQRHLEIHGKIGRNEPCPCNSGLKYKKCCLGKM